MLLQKAAADFVAGHIGVSDSLVKDMVFSHTSMTHKESLQVFTHSLSQGMHFILVRAYPESFYMFTCCSSKSTTKAA